LAPERVLYINGTSKSLIPSLRIAFVVMPPDLAARVATGVRTTIWMAAPLMAEVMRRWVEGGQFMRFVTAKRRIGRERQALARRMLAGAPIAPTHPNALHLWLALPEPWTDEAFAAEAQRNGVLVNAGTHFAIGRPPLDAVRIALGAPPTTQALERGLGVLAGLLRRAAEPMLSIV
jgi:DNA-binding transcriptional MocR family regulator